MTAGQMTNPPIFLLIDGHSLAYRAYYAFAKGRDGGLRTSGGLPTSVCFGFLKSLMEAIPTVTGAAGSHPRSVEMAVAVAFDLGEPTFRHEADANYKGDRAETPADFITEMPLLQELLAALNLQIFTHTGYEADDIIGTIAQKAAASGYQVQILSGDRDLFQLVTDTISVLYLSPGKKAITNQFGPEQVQEKLGILPTQVVDYKALCGDKSDSIPGVPGIGEKTAVQLLKEYGDLDNIYNSLDKIKVSIRQKLIDGKASAYHSRFLAQIATDVPLDISLENCQLRGFDSNNLTQILQKLEFRDFIAKIDQLQQQFGGEIAPPLTPNLSPFKGGRGDGEGSRSTLTPNPNALTPNPSPKKGEGSRREEEDLRNRVSPEVSNADIQLSLFPEPSPEPRNRVSHPDSSDSPPETGFLPHISDLNEIADLRNPVSSPVSYPVSTPFRIIDTPEKLADLLSILQTCTDVKTPVAWDTETTALEPRDAKLVGIGCCWGTTPDDVAYIPLGHTHGVNLELKLVLETLRPILESAAYPKCLHNAKFDRLVFRSQGINLAGVVLDTMLASYILNPETTHNLTDVSRRHLVGIEAQTYKSLKLAKNQTIADLDIPTAASYCGMDVYATFLLVPELRQELELIPELQQLLQEVELPLEPVLAEMAWRGIRIDSAYLQQLSQQLETDLGEIEQQAYAAAGEPFNLGSPKQLSYILFDKLQLDRKKSRKIKTGYSTDAAVLEKLQGEHPLIDVMLQHRTLAKLKSTYVDALPELVRRDTGRLHCEFNQYVTATGRLSSSNPNLQNIPIRTEFSRQIRKAFLPEPGWLLVSADYSQIELRILAHLSGEPVLVEAYQNNRDVHALTAQLLFEKEQVTGEERRLGKTINFGVIYGMGAQRFAREAGFTVAEGKRFIDRFNQRYPQVFAYLEQQKRCSIALGYVATIIGRRRYFQFEAESLRRLEGCNPADIDLGNLGRLTQNDAQLLRAAANAPIQGSSADIIKMAMVKLHSILPQYRARMLLQVHDELVFEVPPEELESLQMVIRDTMENAVALSVPLLVDVRAGDNWMEAK
ncbi:DNA polymerase I [[Phormidium] sp. ETS-05]|uniref:DNA polymerase I n=1 Tax=[Phormidium] sp. ETS-05 TaxID=222819 RepID=UPI0018EEEDF2|nr:DNA polymerase I [[Phormidium] sp. ETS-05]